MVPEFLQNKLKLQYGDQLTKEIIDSYKEDRVVSLRINNLKNTKEHILEVLKNNNISYKEISWYENALIIENATEKDITNLDIYHNGEIYLQSLSSQIPPLFVNPSPNEQILDMTAAPGGKTTELSALADNKVMITAIEKNKIRAERLKYNIEKLGAKKVIVLNTDARNLNEYFIFDKILLDAPCSGSGTLNKDTLNTFTEELVNRSISFQKALIDESIKHLKVGGELIYSTCSILKEENDNMVEYILKKYQDIELIPLDLTNFQELPILPSIDGTLCIKPNKYYEGFFVSKFKKNK